MPGTDHKVPMDLLNRLFLLFQNLHDNQLMGRPHQVTQRFDDEN